MYQSLYRKYRPKNFDEIVGQEKVVEIIKNQIKLNKLGHAYLFTGVRGTGKTSIAKIFAKAINCSNNNDGNPCLKCKECLSISDGANVDIIEMDAASNNGVDDIRLIKEQTDFLPTNLKYKVYIIDEVHMLSGGAFNALLKTLEEPPSHVKFILATTEPQKLPATIISRCQRFEFMRISEEKIKGRLHKIAEENEINIEEEALALVASLANGSMRDGISILESVSNLEGKINKDAVRETVGLPNMEKMIDVLGAIIEGDISKTLKISNELMDEGKEPQSYITELLKLLESIYLKEESLIELYSKQEQELLKKYMNIDKFRVYKIIKEVLNIINVMKNMENKKVMLIAALMNMAQMNNQEFSEGVLKENIDIKKATVNPIYQDKDKNKEKEELKVKEQETIIEKTINKENNEIKGTKEKLDMLAIRKYMLINKEMKLFVILNNAEIYVNEEKAYLTSKTKLSDDIVSKENMEIIRKAIQNVTGKDYIVEYVEKK